MQGHVITAHDPKEPYKLLGVWYTMDLQWKKQQEEVCKALKSMAAHLGRCYNTQAQKLRTLQSCLKAKARYPFALMCYNEKALDALDKVMDSVVRQAYKLPPGTPTAMIREDLKRGGLGNTSLMVPYTVAAVKNFIQAVNDQSKRGQLTRALLEAQLQAYTHPAADKAADWVPTYSLRMRQLMQGVGAGIYMYQNGEEAYPLPATEVAQTILGNVEYWDRDSTLMQIRKPLLKLQELGIFRLGELLNKKGKRLLSAQDIARNLGIRSMKTKYVTSLNEVAKFLASQDYLNGAASAARGYNVDSEHVRWIRRKLDGEAAHRPPPPNTLKACYEKATWAQLHQKTVELSCGGKREHAIAFDPQLRQSDPVLTADGKTDIGSSEQNRPDSNACGQRHLEIGEPETDDCTLTRKQRASQLLSKRYLRKLCTIYCAPTRIASRRYLVQHAWPITIQSGAKSKDAC